MTHKQNQASLQETIQQALDDPSPSIPAEEVFENIRNGQNKLAALQFIKRFQNGELSFGQLSKALGKSQHETMSLLGSLDIPIADYDFGEDLRAIDEFISQQR